MVDIPPTRASLLVRLRDPRDESAWSQFVDIYAPVVYGYARKQGLQDADAADVAQEVLGAVAGAVGRLEYDPRRGSFRGWLFTVVRRKLANWRRKQRARPADQTQGEMQPLDQYPAPQSEAEWDTEWEQRLFAWACAQARREVAEETWRAFWRTVIDGQTGKQVAAELGLTLASVYHARSRVRSRLRELVQSVQEP
jgi:RNA polymerase sigma-70 factor (ECF subfamily)